MLGGLMGMIGGLFGGGSRRQAQSGRAQAGLTALTGMLQRASRLAAALSRASDARRKDRRSDDCPRRRRLAADARRRIARGPRRRAVRCIVAAAPLSTPRALPPPAASWPSFIRNPHGPRRCRRRARRIARRSGRLAGVGRQAGRGVPDRRRAREVPLLQGRSRTPVPYEGARGSARCSRAPERASAGRRSKTTAS